ncbi:hypothetical protein [Streptomyces sp. NPDC055186]
MADSGRVSSVVGGRVLAGDMPGYHVDALLKDRQNRRTLPGVLWRAPLLGTRAAGIADPKAGAALMGPDINTLPYVNRAFLPQVSQPAPTATDLTDGPLTELARVFTWCGHSSWFSFGPGS